MSKAKRRTSLPRVTLMAYSRRDLVAFVSAVETLRHLVDDLRIIAEELKAKPRVRRAAPQPATSSPPASSAAVIAATP